MSVSSMWVGSDLAEGTDQEEGYPSLIDRPRVQPKEQEAKNAVQWGQSLAVVSFVAISVSHTAETLLLAFVSQRALQTPPREIDQSPRVSIDRATVGKQAQTITTMISLRPYGIRKRKPTSFHSQMCCVAMRTCSRRASNHIGGKRQSEEETLRTQ